MPPSTKRKSRDVIAVAGAIISTLAGMALAETAAAQGAWPDGVVIEWQAPALCPGPDYVRGRVASLLSASAHNTALAGPTTFRGQVSPSAAGFRLEVQTSSAAARETKVVDADRCELAAEAFALIVAFAVDPASSVGERAAQPPAPAPPAPLEPAALSQPPFERTSTSPNIVDRSATAPNTSPPPLAIGPLVATGAGVLPMPALAIGGAIAFGVSPRWEIEGRYWLSRQVDLATDVGPGAVQVSLLAGRFSGCLPWSGESRFAACLGAELGRMRGEGARVSAPDQGDSWWAAPSAGVAARLPVAPHFDLRLRLDVGVPLFRPSFTIQHADVPREVEGFRPAPVFAVLTFAPELTFFATENRAAGHP